MCKPGQEAKDLTAINHRRARPIVPVQLQPYAQKRRQHRSSEYKPAIPCALQDGTHLQDHQPVSQLQHVYRSKYDQEYSDQRGPGKIIQ